VIEIQSNAFIVLRDAAADRWMEGRLAAYRQHADSTVTVKIIAGRQVVSLNCPPWMVLHWHNQPPEAYDTPTWRTTREAIAGAMMQATIERLKRQNPPRPPREPA
jgi:hypothetical protein